MTWQAADAVHAGVVHEWHWVTWQALVSFPHGVGRCWGEHNTAQRLRCNGIREVQWFQHSTWAARVAARSWDVVQWVKGKVQVTVDLAMSFAYAKLITRPHSCFRAGLNHLESCTAAQMWMCEN